jgi:hypothetical protein
MSAFWCAPLFINGSHIDNFGKRLNVMVTRIELEFYDRSRKGKVDVTFAKQFDLNHHISSADSG